MSDAKQLRKPDERELVSTPAKQAVAMRIKTRVRAGGGADKGWVQV
jgi:hypothetical protein